MMPPLSHPTVVVVGGGVLGVSAAYHLAHRGAEVVLLERDHLAAGASWGNAGTVSPGHPPLNQPGRVGAAVRQMMDPTSPLYIEPRWDPGLWGWLLDFARNCTAERVEEVMRILSPLGHEALTAFGEIIETEGLDCGFSAEGYLDVCRTEEGLEEAAHEAEVIRPHGYHPELLDAQGVAQAEPTLGPMAGGVFYPEAATLRPDCFVRELADAARRRGACLREGVEVAEVMHGSGTVRGVRTVEGEVVGADAVVLATGPFSLALSEELGISLPVQPGKGYHQDVEVAPDGAPPLRTACVLHETSVFCTPMEGSVRFAGTMEFSGLNDTVRRPRLEQLTRAARTYFPDLGARPPHSEWCGLRPVSSDGLPVVGPVPGMDDVVLATGHGMLGLTLGPVSGALVADWILEGGPDPLYRALAPSRFTGG